MRLQIYLSFTACRFFTNKGVVHPSMALFLSQTPEWRIQALPRGLH
jgi:hypothetical protein